jgi:hypothetical protein
MVWYDFIHMWQFWLVMLGIGVFLYTAVIKSTFLKKIPILNRQNTFVLLAIGGLLMSTGALSSVFGNAGTGSLGGAGDMSISDIQLTTAFLNNGSGTLSENNNVDDLLDVRLSGTTDVNESSNAFEVYAGQLSVTRIGSLKPTSCEVEAIVPPKYANEAGDDGSRYSIVELTALGEPEVYLASGAIATSTSPKKTVALAFADGVATTTLGVAIEIDQEGHDVLNQYSYKDIVLNVCGAPYTMRIHSMD